MEWRLIFRQRLCWAKDRKSQSFINFSNDQHNGSIVLTDFWLTSDVLKLACNQSGYLTVPGLCTLVHLMNTLYLTFSLKSETEDLLWLWVALFCKIYCMDVALTSNLWLFVRQAFACTVRIRVPFSVNCDLFISSSPITC